MYKLQQPPIKSKKNALLLAGIVSLVVVIVILELTNITHFSTKPLRIALS
jgi:hypothetical protein